MQVAPSISFSLNEDVDRSGRTHPLGELAVTADTSPLPDWPDELSFTRSVYAFEWSFERALCAVPKVLAGEPTVVFGLEWGEWWAVPGSGETSWLVWKASSSDPDDRPPVPLARETLADAIVEYCQTSDEFDADGLRRRAVRRLAERSLAHYRSADGVPTEDLRYEEARAWVVTDGSSPIDSRAEAHLDRDGVIERLVADVSAGDDDEAAERAYERLLTDERHRRTALEALREHPDPRAIDVFAWSVWGAEGDAARRTVDATAAVLDHRGGSSPPGGDRSVDPIEQLSAFAGHSEAAARERVAAALTDVTCPRAGEILAPLARDEDEAVRERALIALWRDL